MGPFRDPSEEPFTMATISIIGLDVAKSSFAAHFDCGGSAFNQLDHLFTE
jgi:hypothetical protein